MGCKFICDGCGKEKPATFYPRGQPGWHKPSEWYQRQDKDGVQDACCYACIDKIAKDSGKTRVVIPI